METYELTIEDWTDGITYVSLVHDPAVLVGWQRYNDGGRTFIRMSDNEQHLITGVLMIPDAKIYRRDGDFEYYVYYSKDTVRKMAERMLDAGTYRNNDIEHSNFLIEGMRLNEVFIKDTAKGIVPEGFASMPDGSLFATYHVDSMELWQDIKEGKVQGFSIEGLFSAKDGDSTKPEIETINTNMSIKTRLARLLATFAQTETKEGILTYKEDELAQGVEVYIDDELTPAPDGEYHTDEVIITVTDGKVAEIVEIKIDEDEALEEETTENQDENESEPDYAVEIDTLKADVDQLKNEIDALKAEIEDLKAIIGELEKPAEKPIEETFNSVTTNKTRNKAAEILRSMNRK